MASLIAKKRANTLYYYVVESARVDGKPRIVHQTYLGTAERVAALIKDSTAPVPLSATSIAFGLPGALWLTAERSGAFAALTSLWPTPRSGPSTAHYLLLAAIHRICEPGPKTEVADWYRHSVLHSLWGFPPERFTSQAFWDCFDQIESAAPTAADQLQQAQTRLLGAWKDKQLISRRLLAYDTTNFHEGGVLEYAQQSAVFAPGDGGGWGCVCVEGGGGGGVGGGDGGGAGGAALCFEGIGAAPEAGEVGRGGFSRAADGLCW